jgi:MFS family permease
MLGLVRIRVLLIAVFLLNLSFTGLLTNFPLFSNVRFGWDTTANAFFFAFVGACAVLTQGMLLGKLQPRFGEERLLLGGLTLMALNLCLIALVPSGPLLYPVVGILAIGTGLAIPALTTLISRRVSEREQGKVMGGQQAILSMTLVLGPLISGLAFDHLGVPSPYWIGGLLAALALLVSATALLPNHSAVLAGRNIVESLFSVRRFLRKPRKPGG